MFREIRVEVPAVAVAEVWPGIDREDYLRQVEEAVFYACEATYNRLCEAFTAEYENNVEHEPYDDEAA